MKVNARIHTLLAQLGIQYSHNYQILINSLCIVLVFGRSEILMRSHFEDGARSDHVFCPQFYAQMGGIAGPQQKLLAFHDIQTAQKVRLYRDSKPRTLFLLYVGKEKRSKLFLIFVLITRFDVHIIQKISLGSTSLQPAHTLSFDQLHKIYVKSGDEHDTFRSSFPPDNRLQRLSN